jgi:hypothetical protein
MTGVLETTDDPLEDPDPERTAESVSDLDDDAVVLISGDHNASTAHRAECGAVDQARNIRRVKVRQLNDSFSLCQHLNCWGDPNRAGADQTRTCPLCGKEDVDLVGHLPCDGGDES